MEFPELNDESYQNFTSEQSSNRKDSKATSNLSLDDPFDGQDIREEYLDDDDISDIEDEYHEKPRQYEPDSIDYLIGASSSKRETPHSDFQDEVEFSEELQNQVEFSRELQDQELSEKFTEQVESSKNQMEFSANQGFSENQVGLTNNQAGFSTNQLEFSENQGEFSEELHEVPGDLPPSRVPHPITGDSIFTQEEGPAFLGGHKHSLVEFEQLEAALMGDHKEQQDLIGAYLEVGSVPVALIIMLSQ